MDNSRRDFLKSTARAAAVMTLPATASAMAHRPISVSPASIAARFQGLPGDLGWKILVTRPDRSTAFVAGQDAGRRLFAASAIKTFVLAEALRQFDSDDIKHRLEQQELVLDSSIWSLGSPIFNPPDLSGTVSARTALEAMITRSGRFLRRTRFPDIKRFGRACASPGCWFWHCFFTTQARLTPAGRTHRLARNSLGKWRNG